MTMFDPTPRISVVTPTLNRPREVDELLDNLSQQTCLPLELILVDGAPEDEKATEEVVKARAGTMSYEVNYIRHGGGTAIQRNVGIDVVRGDFIAFIDDDIRLEPDFFEQMLKVYAEDRDRKIGGIAGYINNQFLNPETSPRWRWYRRLRLFTTYEPGRYDYQTGAPINRYLQPPHTGLREIDFMGAGCAIWRRQVFDDGLRFSAFFTGYGVLEDAHLALRAKKKWRLLEYGGARCVHLHAPSNRLGSRERVRVASVNHRYVFLDIVPHRTLAQEFRFWRLQFFDLLRLMIHAVRFGGADSWGAVVGKAEGMMSAVKVKTPRQGKVRP